jgi:hypothetical protein
MSDLSIRDRLLIRVCVAHLVGLFVVGLWGSIGSTSGDSLGGVGVGGLLGVIMSAPWFAALLLFVWFHADWIRRHVLIFCLCGPPLVCGSWLLIFGTAMLDLVAVSCAASSSVYFILAFRQQKQKLAQS